MSKLSNRTHHPPSVQLFGIMQAVTFDIMSSMGTLFSHKLMTVQLKSVATVPLF